MMTEERHGDGCDLQQRGRHPERGQCTRNQREPAQHCVRTEDHATRNDQPDVVRPVACRCDHHPQPLKSSPSAAFAFA